MLKLPIASTCCGNWSLSHFYWLAVFDYDCFSLRPNTIFFTILIGSLSSGPIKRIEERKEQEAEARQDRFQGVLDRFITLCYRWGCLQRAYHSELPFVRWSHVVQRRYIRFTRWLQWLCWPTHELGRNTEVGVRSITQKEATRLIYIMTMRGGL